MTLDRLDDDVPSHDNPQSPLLIFLLRGQQPPDRCRLRLITHQNPRITRTRLHLRQLSVAHRVNTQQLCVDDICVTRDQFAEVFGNQSAAAGAPNAGTDTGATGGLPVGGTNGPSIISINGDNPAAILVGTTTAANDNTPVTEATSDTQLVEDPSAGKTPALPEPANHNFPLEQLPATGTE